MDQDGQVCIIATSFFVKLACLSVASTCNLCFKLRRGTITFGSVPPANVCPKTFVGKVYTSEMSKSDIQLISSVCNENQTFLVEYTPFDNLTIAKRVLEQCFEGKRKKNSPLLVGVRSSELRISRTNYISFVVHQLKGNTWEKSPYLISQPTEAYEWYTKTFKCPPPLGRTVFNEWVLVL